MQFVFLHLIRRQEGFVTGPAEPFSIKTMPQKVWGLFLAFYINLWDNRRCGHFKLGDTI